MKHRFVNDGVAPASLGKPSAASETYACVCGMSGTHADVVRHLADSAASPPWMALDGATTARYAPISSESGDDFGGDTKAHYLPNEPRTPALPAPPCRARGCLAPLDTAGLCVVHFADSGRSSNFSTADHADPPSIPELPPPPSSPFPAVVDPPETRESSRSRSIAESFQDMLRQAFEAGAVAAASGELFESWYAREVLR